MFRGGFLMWWTMAFLLLYFGFLLWLKRYFRPATPPSYTEISAELPNPVPPES